MQFTTQVCYSSCCRHCSVTKSCPTFCVSMEFRMPGSSVLHYLPVCWNSCPSSWWCHLITSSSAVPFSSCLQSFPASGSFPKRQLFPSGGQSIGASASASVLPVSIQCCWFPLGLTDLISLRSKGLSLLFLGEEHISYIRLIFLPGALSKL